MSKRIKVDGYGLIVEDTVSGDVELDIQAKSAWYDSDVLDSLSEIHIYQDGMDTHNGVAISIDLADAVNYNDVSFTKATWRTFARNSLGFSSASGGSGAIYKNGTFDLDATVVGKTLVAGGDFDKTLTFKKDLAVGKEGSIRAGDGGKVTLAKDVEVTFKIDPLEEALIGGENQVIGYKVEDENEIALFGGLNLVGNEIPARTYDDMDVVLTPVTDTALTTLAWPIIQKSSDWPEFTIAKDYFSFYGTDHHSTPVGLRYAEMDDPDFTNFAELGTMIDNSFKFEMCWLFRVPSGESSLTTDEIWVVGHDLANPAGSFGVNANQQTRLFTTSGGNTPLLSTWTDRGNILGYDTDLDPQHTGYMTIYRKGVGDYVATHFMDTSSNGTNWTDSNVDWWVSTASDPGGPWTHDHEFSPTGGTAHLQPTSMLPFTFEGKDFIAGIGDAYNTIAIFDSWNEFLQPTNKVFDSQIIDGFMSHFFYREGNDLHLYTKNGDSGNRDRPIRHYILDLRVLR